MFNSMLLLKSILKCRVVDNAVKFREGLCEVSSIYVRSTARVFELYNTSELNGDNEYICTARGEPSVQNDFTLCIRDDIVKDENSVCSGDGSLANPSESSVSSSKEIGTQPFLQVDEHDIESTDDQNPSDILDRNKNGTLQTMLDEDSIMVPEEMTKNESHGSDEDSWIEVKISGSFVMDSLGEPGSTSTIQSLGDKNELQGTRDQQFGISIEYDYGHRSTSVKDMSFHQHLAKEKVGPIGASENCSTEKLEDKEVRADGSSTPFPKSNLSRQAFYEATVEIVNAKPCASLTIRLLSLQDKSFVEIDEICVYGLPAPAVTVGTENIGLSSGSSLLSSSFGGSLLAMLVPNMLQMSRVGSSQMHELFVNSPNVKGERNVSEHGFSEPESSRSTCQPLISSPSAMADFAASVGGYLSSSRVPGNRFSSEWLLHQEKLPHSLSSPDSCLDTIGENVKGDKNNLKGIMGNSTTSRSKMDDVFRSKERQYEVETESAYLEEMVGVNKPDRIDELEVRESFEQCSARGLKNTEVHEGSSGKISAEIMLEHLSKRMDKLDAFCMRIEAYVHEALNNMERRLQLVESRQMLPNQSLSTKMEGVTLHSGLCFSSNSLLNSSVSCPEMFNNTNRKHMSTVDTPCQSCSEFPSSISMPSFVPVSSADCSLVCAMSSSFNILSLDASCPVTSTGSESQSMHSLSSSEELSKDDLQISSSNIIPDELASSSLEPQDLSKEEEFSGEDSHSAEGVSADSDVLSKSIFEHPTLAKRPALSIEEALASALSAFSASVSPPQVETTDSSIEAPIKNTDDNEVCYPNIVSDTAVGLTTKVETTGICAEARCCSSDIDNTEDEELCCRDDTFFGTIEGVRYISQESMDSVPYSSYSQGSQDARHTVYRLRKIGDSQDSVSVTILQSCKPATEMVTKLDGEITLSNHKIECRLPKSDITLAENNSDPVHASQNMNIFREEFNMVHDHQEQLQPLKGSEELVSSTLCANYTNLFIEKGHNLAAGKASLYGNAPRNIENEILGIEALYSSLKMEARQRETTIESNDYRLPYDKNIPRKLQQDSSSLLDVSFTTSDIGQTRMPLESLLCDHTPEEVRETLRSQETTKVETSVNFPEPKRPHGLFFVEDEDLGDFIIPSASALLSSVSAGNNTDRGTLPGVSYDFESLL
eukprot:Gb_31421 [translate_table: standard]